MVDQVVITEAPTTAVVETTDITVVAPKTDIQVVTTTQDKVAVVQTDSIDVATVEKDSTIIVESKDISVVTQGQQGPPGIDGAQGVSGVPIFLVAEEGEQGDMGPQGVKGDTGATGATGATGTTGVAGTNGVDGAQGVPGVPLFLTAEDGEEGPMGPPGTGSGSGGVGTYFDPVTWNGSTDRVLGVGQITQDSFTSATSMPLHIACGDGQIYEIEMVGTSTPAASGADTLLLINNASMSGNFGFFYHQVYGASTITGGNTTSAATGFIIAPGCSPYYAKATVFTTTNLKSFLAESRGTETTNGLRQWRVMMDAPDTTTVWSSLGTIAQPNAWTGQVVCRRIA